MPNFCLMKLLFSFSSINLYSRLHVIVSLFTLIKSLSNVQKVATYSYCTLINCDKEQLILSWWKIIAAIYDFYSSGRVGRERNLYQWGFALIQKERGGVRAMNFSSFPTPLPTVDSNFRPNMSKRLPAS